VLTVGWLLAQTSSSSSDKGFSVPILVGAAAAGVIWVVGALVLGVIRRAPAMKTGPTTQEIPPETPAVANLLCDDFELGTEAVPATVLDLAARRILTLEEVQPGQTICRVRGSGAEGLTPPEQRVLDAIASKAFNSVVPTEALTTGTAAASSGWQRAYKKEVNAEAQSRGLTYDRWPARLVAIAGLGVFVVGGLLFLSGSVGGDTTGREGARAIVAGSIAVASIIAITAITGRWQRSLAQLPTPDGKAAAARCLGLQRHLRENEPFDDLPPAAVTIWGRHLAYAGALGAAAVCVATLPMGAEDDHHAWSRFGSRWRKVNVRYPRALPPGWGKHPGFALFLAIVWGAIGVAAIYGLTRVARAELTPDPTFSREQLDWVGRGALILCLPFGAVVLWSLWVLIRAVPDFWLRQTLTGEVVRARTRQQIVKSGDSPKYWYYLGIDYGSDRRLSAYRVRSALYNSCNQGDTVTAVVTPNLRYVRELRTT
jgi:hypothetical protein